MKKSIFRILCCVLVLLLLPTVQVRAASTTFHHVDQVMIYNPKLDPGETMSTGNMAGQISASAANYSLLPEKTPLQVGLDPDDVAEILQGVSMPAADVPITASLTPNLAQTSEEVGTRQSFKYAPAASFSGASKTFTCLYAGSHCLVWGYNYSQTDVAALLGTQFDEEIKPMSDAVFGSARYIQDGQKLNILIYPFNSSGLLGFFMPMELLTVEEAGNSYSRYYNLGTPVIHVNATWAQPENYTEYCAGTIAHEYQHLICFSSTLLGNGYQDLIMMDLWLNEAMAQYAAEQIDPGYMARNGYITGSYNGSNLIANGQSLYNFGTNGDVGVYGQGYLLSSFLMEHGAADSSVFSAMHQYWRTASQAELTMPKLFEAAMTQPNFQSQVAWLHEAVALDGDADTFLSRMNLAFQIAMTHMDGEDIYDSGEGCVDASPKVCTKTSVEIEGGGRILVNTADGESYTVPADADPDLIYVGFQDGRMTIQPTRAADYGAIPETLSLEVAATTAAETSRTFYLTFETPEETNCLLMAAAYDATTGKMYRCEVVPLDLVPNAYRKTVTLPDGNLIWKLYLLDGQTPMIEAITWTGMQS